MLLDETIRDKQSSEDDNGETCSSSSTEVQGTLNLTQFADLSIKNINCHMKNVSTRQVPYINILISSVASLYNYLIPSTAGDLGQNVAEMEHEFSYDLLGNDLEGKF